MKNIFTLTLAFVIVTHVDAQSNTYPWPSTGFVGIGTTSPQGPLHILNNANTQSILLESSSLGWGSGMIFKNTAANGKVYGMYSGAWGAFQITDNNLGVNRFLIGNNGNIGIGTDAPWAKLDVRTAGVNAADQNALNINNPTNEAYGTVSLVMGVSNVTSAMISAQRNNLGNGSSLFFHTADASGVNQPRMWINDAGNVGIGTLTPFDRLHVKGRLRVEDNYDNGGIGGSLILSHPGKTTAGIAKDWVLYNMAGQYGNSLQFWAYDNVGCGSGGLCNARFTIRDNGNVGIGTSTPLDKLQIGDQFLFHDGGWKGIMYNMAWDGVLNQSTRIGTGPASAMYLTNTGNISFYTVPAASQGSIINNGMHSFVVYNSGQVGIGTNPSLTTFSDGSVKLFIEGGVRARKIKVDQTSWADFVFEKDYNLPSLAEVEKYVQKNKHLMGVPSQREVQENGLDLGSNQAVLLQKIEELTLYLIEQNKQIELLQKKVEKLENEKRKD